VKLSSDDASFEEAYQYLLASASRVGFGLPDHTVQVGETCYHLTSSELIAFSAGYRSAKEGDKSLPPFPGHGTFEDALLAVLRLGYSVQLDMDKTGKDGSLHQELINLKELGWPIEELDVATDPAPVRTYAMGLALAPEWTNVDWIPIIRMSAT